MRIFGQWLNLNARLPLECPPSAQPCHPTALRDFEGAFVGCGSIAIHAAQATCQRMSAAPQNRTFLKAVGRQVVSDPMSIHAARSQRARHIDDAVLVVVCAQLIKQRA